MARLGNTPLRHTNFFLDRGKSYAFTMKFVDKEGLPHDLSGAEVRIVVEEPQHLGGAEVFPPLIAFMEDPVGGVVRFQFQASDLLLEPGEYPYDVTLLAAMGYSSPVLKGLFVIGSNTDDKADNKYTGVDLSHGLTVTLDQGHVVEVCLDYAVGLKGDKGAQGEVVVIDTITTAPGSMARVEDLDENPSRAALRFYIPRGEPGAPGQDLDETDHGGLTGLEDDDHLHYHTDARGDTRYVRLSGSTMSGELILSQDADEAMGAVTFQQLAAAVGGGTEGLEEVWVGPETPPMLQQIWIDTNEPDPGSGAGGVVEAGYYRHDQAVPLVTWVVNHNLNYRPAVHTQDAVGNVLYGSVAHLSDVALTITFAQAMTGSAHCS